MREVQIALITINRSSGILISTPQSNGSAGILMSKPDCREAPLAIMSIPNDVNVV